MRQTDDRGAIARDVRVNGYLIAHMGTSMTKVLGFATYTIRARRNVEKAIVMIHTRHRDSLMPFKIADRVSVKDSISSPLPLPELQAARRAQRDCAAARCSRPHARSETHVHKKCRRSATAPAKTGGGYLCDRLRHAPRRRGLWCGAARRFTRQRHTERPRYLCRR